ncbi:hypothetical protein [Psychroserpens sp. NJDZ02]|uniref:hypothetical protein n=1 Tax=Psychroserpens sp. NJDZ02 TaxID=2570561 RepID=UPI0010A92EF1|nr:hypothetical protein [Psychroserpens sp. NJDZ02]QCE41950.1 hypothetical protein E9099_11165 [Psychroserpens sp. NJDZ02]
MNILKKIIITLSIVLTASCQNEKKTKELKSTTEELVPFNRSLDTIENITLDASLLNTDDTVVLNDSLNLIKKNIFENFEHLQKTFFFNELEVSTILLYKGEFIDSLEINDDGFIGHYFMKVFDRTPENIKIFFGDNEIEILAKMIIDNNNYIGSRTNLWLDGFIKAYEELKNDPEFLMQASIEKDVHAYYELITSKYSTDVTEIMDFESDYDLDYKLFKIYSFWVRRYNEGNSEVVFSIIKKFKDQFPAEIETDKLNSKKNVVESKILDDEFSAFDFNEDILNYIIAELDINNNYFERFIAENSIFIARNDMSLQRFSEYSTEVMTKLNKEYSDFDRTPENIDEIFNTNLIDYIAFLFNNEFLVKDQKLYDVLKGLLLTYDEMDDDECERLHHIMKEYEYHDMRDEFIKNCSDTVSEFIYNGGDFKSSFEYGSDIDFGYSKRIFYLYSFWVRRYNEGNKETVYKILKEVDGKIN